jgi:SAM-dependent methyltransferase
VAAWASAPRGREVTTPLHRRPESRPDLGTTAFPSAASVPLYDALAPTYHEHFAVPHRRAYDDLAWELIQPLLPDASARIVDVGCGIGRWARRLVDLGHFVIGIEQAPEMAARARELVASGRFELHELPMEEAQLPERQADLVLAMGSLQYSVDPEQMLQRLGRWVRPGGWVVVLVDSLIALVLELLAAGKEEEALLRLETQRATWTQGDLRADYHLLDTYRLERAFQDAGLVEIHICGLLVGWSALGRERMLRRLADNHDRQMAVERCLAGCPLVADLGKQLYGSGRVPIDGKSAI